MASAEVLYGLARKWWDLYISSPEYTPPSSDIHSSPLEVTLDLDNQEHLEWSIWIESDPQPVDYIILDSEQWRKFCNWYYGGPELKPKSIGGLHFQYDGKRNRLIGPDKKDIPDLKSQFRLREAGGIPFTEILIKSIDSSGDSIVPMKVHTLGIWPDDMSNAMPNVSEFEHKEVSDDLKRDGGGGRRRRWRRREAAMENLGGAVLPVGIVNLGATCYMNASFQLLLRPLLQAHFDRVKEIAERTPEAVILQEFVQVWRLLLTNNFNKPIELTEQLIPTILSSWAARNGGGPHFNKSATEDSQEFLQFIFDKILAQYCKEFCMETFAIKESQIFLCRNCNQAGPPSQNLDDDLAWMLGVGFPLRHDNNAQPLEFNFLDLLTFKYEYSKIDGACSNCQSRDNSWTRPKLYSTSQFLIMYLGRAILNENRLNHRVQVPQVLDLRAYFREDRVDEKTHYKLCGVMEHQMLGNVGHFVTKVEHDAAGSGALKWFEFNDDNVTTVTDFHINPEDIYMLMYQRL